MAFFLICFLFSYSEQRLKSKKTKKTSERTPVSPPFRCFNNIICYEKKHNKALQKRIPTFEFITGSTFASVVFLQVSHRFVSSLNAFVVLFFELAENVSVVCVLLSTIFSSIRTILFGKNFSRFDLPLLSLSKFSLA